MTLRVRPYDPNRPRKPTTPAQDAASQRNFGIFQLRGLWSLAGMLREPFRTTVRTAVDDDLRQRGAEPQATREAARAARWKAEIPEDDLIPF